MANQLLWAVHGDGVHVGPGEVVAPEERLAWPQTVGIGLQHVLAMFGATFLVPVLTGFPPTTTIFFSGIGTILFITITRGRGQKMGLPSYLGSSFAFISPVIVAMGGKLANAGGDISAALGGIFIAGALFFVVGMLVDRFGHAFIDWLMPPVVTGAVVALIGLNLAPAAAASFMQQGWTAFATLSAVLLFTVLFKGFMGRISILLGIVFGYLIAIPQGQIHWDGVKSADWLGLPTFNGPSFSWHAITLLAPVVLILIAENTGHVKAVGTMCERNLDKSLGRAYMGDGLSTMLAGLGGGSGTTTYAENIGVMAATKVYSTAAYYVAGSFAILLGFIPKFGALIFSLPAGVLGGATTVLYGLIAVLGARIWVENKVDFKDPINLIPAAIALIVGAANYTFSRGDVSFNGIAMGAFGVIFAYQVMKYLQRWRMAPTSFGTFLGTSTGTPPNGTPKAPTPPPPRVPAGVGGGGK